MTTPEIKSDTKVVRQNDIVAAEISGEMVMMHVEKGSYFALTGSGSMIWEKLASPISSAELASTLEEEFDVTRYDNLEPELRKLLADLLAKDLLAISD